METEDRNKQAPLPSQGLWLLDNSCPQLASALIMGTAPEDGKSGCGRPSGSPGPNCPLLTKCSC